MGIFTKKLIRTTGEVRFKPTLSSTIDVIKCAKILEDKFPHWRMQTEHNISLFDEEKKNLVQVRHNGVFFLNEGTETNEKIFVLLETAYEELLNKTDISDFQHVGIRRRCVIETNFNFKDLVDLTFKKFYGNLSSIKSISGETTNDTIFVLDSTRDNFNVHVQIGPSESEQADKFFDEQFVGEKLLDTKAYLIMDVDVYKKEDLKKDSNFEVLKQIEIMNLEIVDSYIKFLTDK